MNRFTSIKFLNFKKFRNFSVSLQSMNILVGPNNCGKSTVISAFRILNIGLKQAFSHRAIRVPSPNGGQTFGHHIPENQIPVALENVHTDYEDVDSKIEFRISNGNKFILFFPADGGCYLSWTTQGAPIDTPGRLRNAFPVKIQVVPVLGPLEHEEMVVREETVNNSLNTHRASRHFRNYWRYNPEGFNDFASMVEKTWPGMRLNEPELTNQLERKLIMLCHENRMPREVYWAGFGFQVWCQLLTHISRAGDASIFIVDEPEIYLHPDVQRQLLGILREIDTDVLMATHSTEIMGEADPNEILIVDYERRSAKRLKDVEGVQNALESIGSIQNITLTQLARTKKILFCEGLNDHKILRRFAKVLSFQELFAGVDFTALESGGFSSWDKVKALAWGFQQTIEADIFIGTVYDRDYWCDEELSEIQYELDRNINFSHIHKRKEIENYLLSLPVLERVIEKAIRERENRTGSLIERLEGVDEILLSITEETKSMLQSQYLARRSEFLRDRGIDVATINQETIKNFENKWSALSTRLEIVSGKEILRKLRNRVDEMYGISLSDIRIIDEFRREEIPSDLVELSEHLDRIRQQ